MKLFQTSSIKSYLLPSLLGLLWVAHAWADSTVLQMFPMQHRMPQELLPTIKSMVGPEGAVTAIQTQLMVRATPERMRDIATVIESLDTAIQNFRITIKHGSSQQVKRSNVDVTVNGRARTNNGIVIGNRNSESESVLGLNIEDNDLDQRSSSSEFLTVMDGRSAFIKVGQLIPYTAQWSLLVQRYLTTLTFTEFREISTGFTVTPRQIGQEVELEITPTISSLTSGDRVQFTRLTTVVRVRKGEWLDLGGAVETRDEVSRQILSRDANSGNNHETLMVKVDN